MSPPPERDPHGWLLTRVPADQTVGGGEPMHPRRCGMCRQLGHNRSTCPHTAQVARSLAAEYVQGQRAARRDQVQAVRDELFERSLELERERQRAESAEREWRRIERGVWDFVHRERNGPSRLAATVQEIVFENSDKIPDGIYKQLMDALMIKD